MISHKICFFVDSRNASFYPQNMFLWTAGTLLMITHKICFCGELGRFWWLHTKYIFVESWDASDDYTQNIFLWTAETLLMITHKICFCGELGRFWWLHTKYIFVDSWDASDDYTQNMFLWTAETLLMITHKICGFLFVCLFCLFVFFFVVFFFFFFFFCGELRCFWWLQTKYVGFCLFVCLFFGVFFFFFFFFVENWDASDDYPQNMCLFFLFVCLFCLFVFCFCFCFLWRAETLLMITHKIFFVCVFLCLCVGGFICGDCLVHLFLISHSFGAPVRRNCSIFWLFSVIFFCTFSSIMKSPGQIHIVFLLQAVNKRTWLCVWSN